jgi:hypothetical protein
MLSDAATVLTVPFGHILPPPSLVPVTDYATMIVLAVGSASAVGRQPCAVQYWVENNMGGWKCPITLPTDRRTSCGR